MPEEKNILSLTFDFNVNEQTTIDDEGNSVVEEIYTISCADSVCWSLVSDKSDDEEERASTQLQAEHVATYLRERLEHAANRVGNESYFIARKQMSIAAAKVEGHFFFKQRVKSDEARARRLLSIKRGKPQRLSKAQKEKLPEMYDALHAKFKDIKKLHDEKRREMESKRNRGLGHEEWQKEWLSIAKSYYPKEKREHLELIADPYEYISSPSKVAYFALARETGYTQGYMEKLIPKARKGIETD